MLGFTLALPFVAFALIYFAATPQYEIQTRPRRRWNPPAETPTLFLNSPYSSPRDLGLADLSAKKLEQMVRKMESAVLAEDRPRGSVTILKAPEEPAREELRDPSLKRWEGESWVEGLIRPGGIAQDTRNGSVFIAEEDAHRVVVITARDKRRIVLSEETQLIGHDGEVRKRMAPIKRPRALAMADKGRLFVGEYRPGGRLIEVIVSERGKMESASRIALHGKWDDYAWRAMAARPNGELLLAGISGLEQEDNNPALFQSALLYRDAAGDWWAILVRPSAIFSAVAFSKDGSIGLFTDEVSGQIGWIDLKAQYVRQGSSKVTVKSPQGLATLPDGRIAVTDATGNVTILHIEPDRAEQVVSGQGSSGALLWDHGDQRLLLTDSAGGRCVALTPPDRWPTTGDRLHYARMASQGALAHLPSKPPPFLAPLVQAGAGTEAGSAALPAVDAEAFNQLARNVPIIAADAATELLYSTEPAPDPIERLVFMALAPGAAGMMDVQQDFTVSAVLLRTASGKLYKTRLTRMSVLAGNMMQGKFDMVGTFDLPVPFAYQAQISPRGHAVIHFAGLAHSPDIAIALNPSSPEDSYMIVTYMDGLIEQYRVLPGEDGSIDNWVVSLPPPRPEPWAKLAPSTPGDRPFFTPPAL